MTIYTVRKPFLCRSGQFEEGKRHLCVGILLSALMKGKTFNFYIGKNKKILYTADSFEINAYITEKRSFWKNHNDKIVAIVPIERFQTKIS